MSKKEFNEYDVDNFLEYQDEEENIKEDLCEDYFHKNLAFFQCLPDLDVSTSSLLTDPLYHFPELQEQDLDFALWGVAPPKKYDNIGKERYKDLCEKENILPYRRVLQSLHKEVLNLKYYSLSETAMKSICETLIYNLYVEELILQENCLPPNTVGHLNNLLEKSQTLQVLDLKRCNLGIYGVEAIMHGITYTTSLNTLDLSYNDIGDEGVELLAKPLRKNVSIRILNLSHNNLFDRALNALMKVLQHNNTLEELDLSWNYFYSPIGMDFLMEGMTENKSIKKLNLAWNGIGTESCTMIPILKYLRKRNTTIEHLDLSNNRICGENFLNIRESLKSNRSIKSINVGFNNIKPEEAEYLAETFFDRKRFVSKLKEVDVGDTYVTKAFKENLHRIKKKKCIFKYGGILGDYEITGPDFKKLLLKRGRYISANMKKKSQQIDIGKVIIMFPMKEMKQNDFVKLLTKNKIKWDDELLEQIIKEFRNENKKVDTELIKDVYLRMYPDTKPSEPKIKKTKKSNKKKQEVTQKALVDAANNTSQTTIPESKQSKLKIIVSRQSQRHTGIIQPHTSLVTVGNQ